MNNEYIIVNKNALEKRIEELEKERLLELKDDFYDILYLGKINSLKQILSQSAPLIPEIEKAYNWGYTHCEEGCEQDVNDCTSNLKLDI